MEPLKDFFFADHCDESAARPATFEELMALAQGPSNTYLPSHQPKKEKADQGSTQKSVSLASHQPKEEKADQGSHDKLSTHAPSEKVGGYDMANRGGRLEYHGLCPIKAAKALNPKLAATDIAEPCCKSAKCVKVNMQTPSTLMQVRHEYWGDWRGETFRNQKILNLCQTATREGKHRVFYRLPAAGTQGLLLCPKGCWLMMGVGETKFRTQETAAKQGDRTAVPSIHASNNPKQQHVFDFLTRYTTTLCNPCSSGRPNGWHLHQRFKRKQFYSYYVDQTPVLERDRCAGFCSFKKTWKKRFPGLRSPAKGEYGRCDDCAVINDNLAACDPVDRRQAALLSNFRVKHHDSHMLQRFVVEGGCHLAHHNWSGCKFSFDQKGNKKCPCRAAELKGTQKVLRPKIHFGSLIDWTTLQKTVFVNLQNSSRHLGPFCVLLASSI
jgi:hypothetical protein